jgi:hypothetical protein
MAFEKERKFGIIKIEKKVVKLYTSQTSYSSINIGEEISEAKWIGMDLIINIKNGKIRRYTNQNSFSTIS